MQKGVAVGDRQADVVEQTQVEAGKFATRLERLLQAACGAINGQQNLSERLPRGGVVMMIRLEESGGKGSHVRHSKFVMARTYLNRRKIRVMLFTAIG
ncbi:MAG: hypothetical protein JO273_08915 [Methylobacteriaceae bacterium]|nr:hypothetical protein [Methylobacteriaceae bacterium]